MSESLLAYSVVVLLFSSFVYNLGDDRLASTTGLTTTLLFARVIPMMFVSSVCMICVPVRRYAALLKALGTPPFVFWTWFAAVAAISGFLSGLAPHWSLWKCLELFVIVLWAAAVSVHVQSHQSTRLLERIFKLLVVVCYGICLWSISEIFREGDTIRDYFLLNHRLDTEWPHINSITLCVMSLFTIFGVTLLTTRMSLPGRLALLAPLIMVFCLSRSRTGLLALLVVGGFSALTSNISRGRKIAFVLIPACFVLILVSSPEVREYMRIDSWEELARGAGRIETEDGRRSGWGDTVQVIKKSPAIGWGYVIVRRFIQHDHAAVDNFALQALVSAGVIGAAPMILYSIFVFFRWLFGLSFADVEARRIGEMGVLATCIGFVKSLTTNGISAYDFSLILFLFGCVAMQYVLFKHRLAMSHSQLQSQAEEPPLAVEPPLVHAN